MQDIELKEHICNTVMNLENGRLLQIMYTFTINLTANSGKMPLKQQNK